jgi:energy-coupling factor transport system ATP-binding protein
VFQNPELMLFEETVLRELTFCARAQNNEFTEEAALAVLEQYGLLAQRDEFPVNLSMGKKHLLTILSVLFSSAEVIILDEPTLGMDLRLKSQLIQIITELKDKGKTIIVISHDIPLVFRISDEILVLNDGIRLIQDTRQVLAHSDELFAKINISLPPVVLLSKYFGFAPICCDVDSFVQEITVRSTAEIPAAGLAGGM